MPLPILNKQHAIAYEGVVKWLREDATLKRAVDVWRWWDGRDDDPVPASVDPGCVVRITPELGPSEVEASTGSGRVWSRPLDLKIECEVAAWKATDDLNLADAIFARLFPARSTAEADALEAKLATWGVMEIVELQPPTIAGDPSTLTVSAGRYRLEMWMNG